MRILLVSQEFPPETGWGGIGSYCATIAPALARAGAETHVLSVVAGQKRSVRTVDGVHVHRAPLRRLRGPGRPMPATWRRIWLAIAIAVEKRRLGLRFDVCEAPEWNAEGLALAIGSRTPLVVRLHSGARQIFPVLGPLNRDRRLAVRLEEEAVRRADVVTGTKSLTAEVPPRLRIPRERVRTIVYPVPPTEPLPPPAAGPPRVAFVGRFEARKGADTLMRAVPRLSDRVPGVRVVFRGTDTRTSNRNSVAEQLRRLAAALGVTDSVDIVDRWHSDAVAEELRSAHVCAVPSRWESFGLVAAEASALGRPVVASRIPGLDDVVNDGVSGRLVPVEAPDRLADAIADLLTSPEKALRMGEAGARDIGARCDPDRVAAQTLDAYELAIAHHTNGRRRCS